MASLQLENIVRAFGAHVVVPGLSILIEEGEFVVLVGPSGCGKSTLLRMIAGLDAPTSGKIYVNGQDATMLGPQQRGVGMVFQSYALYPHMNARRNIGFGLEMARVAKDVIAERIESAASKLRLNDYLSRKPRELSGGQRQRVAIGRAMTREPNLFLFDEPLSNLDAKLRVSMRAEIGRLRSQLDSTVVYVTHDQIEAMTLADRIVVLDAGSIAQVGTPMELYDNPANQFVAGFIGSPSANFLSGTVLEVTESTAHVQLKMGPVLKFSLRDSAQTGQPVAVGIRPEHVALVEPGQGFAVKTELVELLGSDTFVHFSAFDEPVTIRADGSNRLLAGDEIHVDLESGPSFLFDQSGNRIG